MQTDGHAKILSSSCAAEKLCCTCGLIQCIELVLLANASINWYFLSLCDVRFYFKDFDEQQIILMFCLYITFCFHLEKILIFISLYLTLNFKLKYITFLAVKYS